MFQNKSHVTCAFNTDGWRCNQCRPQVYYFFNYKAIFVQGIFHHTSSYASAFHHAYVLLDYTNLTPGGSVERNLSECVSLKQLHFKTLFECNPNLVDILNFITWPKNMVMLSRPACARKMASDP